MKNHVLIIQGSSRSDGETAKSVECLTKGTGAEVIDLLKLSMAFYDYNYKNAQDDFVPVSQKMIAADKIIFATPVYWYAMSAPMKILFDRFSDLVRVRKQEGRALAGKEIYLLANGTDDDLPPGFETPFLKTAEYLAMHYRGAYYLHTGKNEVLREKTWKGMDIFKRSVFRHDCTLSCANG